MSANPFSGFWSTLAPRERVMILGGSVLILLTVVVMLFASVLSERSDLKQEIASLEEDREWINTQAELLSRLSNSCQQNEIADVAPRDFLSRQAQRNNINVTSLQSSGQGVRVTATASDGNAFLRFSHQILCQGYGIDGLVIEAVEAGGFMATIEVNHGS